MKSNEIRRQFLRFFEERGHKVVPSSSLIPDDPTLLLTNAGMNQFKPYLLGLEEPPYRRAVSVQKVFRALDVENVGHTARHLTFFEMLGNFSFGDYFKREACAWAFELVTQGYGIDPDRLWTSVFESDDEAIGIWADIGIPVERIVRRGKEDNYWYMHTAGPGGPSSEIFVDRGAKYGPDGGPAVDEERFCEIWNIVFMQDECDDEMNVLGPLPEKNIDTGSSLERVAMVLQETDTVFETDVLWPLVETAVRLTGKRYGKDEQTAVSLRVMAEHGRAITFLIADGVQPSNEGRGYVLRMMLRRLVTHARQLGVDKPVTPDLVESTVEIMGEAYPELVTNKAFVLQVAASEEERFGATFGRGMALFEQEAARAKEQGSSVFPGAAAFRLHDTFGFPEEITTETAREQGLEVDHDEFARLMEEQRRRSKEARRRGKQGDASLEEVAQAAGPTEFLGYQDLSAEGRVTGLVADGSSAKAAGEGQQVRVILDRTPFYAEGGGQVGDSGTIRTPSGLIQVKDTLPGPAGTIVHEGVVAAGEIEAGEEARAEVDADLRMATARSHTATHVLHHTLRQSLGEHARQAGSLVAPGRVRFDFAHHEGLSRDDLEEVEGLVNRRLADDQPVRAYETTFDFARSEGAIALFDEKYGDIVRVVEVGDYSIELCGGTHVHHTGEVALLRLISESSIGSGFRRIEALTGVDALKQLNRERRLFEEVMEAVGAGSPDQTPERVRHAMARIKQLETELGKIQRERRVEEVQELLEGAETVGEVQLVVERMDGRQADELRELAIRLRERQPGPAAFVLGSANDGKALLVAAVTAELVARGVTAPALLEEAARALGGRAGGKPDLAIGGGSKADALPQALEGIRGRLASMTTR